MPFFVFAYLPDILMRISPVDVFISHFPPDAVSGTLTFPVEAFATKIFSDLSVPVTSPVDVLTVICAAISSIGPTPPQDV